MPIVWQFLKMELFLHGELATKENSGIIMNGLMQILPMNPIQNPSKHSNKLRLSEFYVEESILEL